MTEKMNYSEPSPYDHLPEVKKCLSDLDSAQHNGASYFALVIGQERIEAAREMAHLRDQLSRRDVPDSGNILNKDEVSKDRFVVYRKTREPRMVLGRGYTVVAALSFQDGGMAYELVDEKEINEDGSARRVNRSQHEKLIKDLRFLGSRSSKGYSENELREYAIRAADVIEKLTEKTE